MRYDKKLYKLTEFTGESFCYAIPCDTSMPNQITGLKLFCLRVYYTNQYQIFAFKSQTLSVYLLSSVESSFSLQSRCKLLP